MSNGNKKGLKSTKNLHKKENLDTIIEKIPMKNQKCKLKNNKKYIIILNCIKKIGKIIQNT